jgi:hypothetical protein
MKIPNRAQPLIIAVIGGAWCLALMKTNLWLTPNVQAMAIATVIYFAVAYAALIAYWRFVVRGSR